MHIIPKKWHFFQHDAVCFVASIKPKTGYCASAYTHVWHAQTDTHPNHEFAQIQPPVLQPRVLRYILVHAYNL